MADNLPIGWIRTTLGEICLPVATVRPTESPNTEFTYFDIGSIDNTTNRIVDQKVFRGRDAPSRARQAVQKDDILFSTVRTYLRKIACIEQIYPNGVASTGFAVIRPADGVSSQFVLFQILSDRFLEPVSALQTGSSYPAVRAKDVFSQPLLLPPSSEQRRIVEKTKHCIGGGRASSSGDRPSPPAPRTISYGRSGCRGYRGVNSSMARS
jgi:type I restriction enzyme S subunit